MRLPRRVRRGSSILSMIEKPQDSEVHDRRVRAVSAFLSNKPKRDKSKKKLKNSRGLVYDGPTQVFENLVVKTLAKCSADGSHAGGAQKPASKTKSSITEIIEEYGPLFAFRRRSFKKLRRRAVKNKEAEDQDLVRTSEIWQPSTIQDEPRTRKRKRDDGAVTESRVRPTAENVFAGEVSSNVTIWDRKKARWVIKDSRPPPPGPSSGTSRTTTWSVHSSSGQGHRDAR